MSDEKPFKCDECPAEFKTRSGLWKHKQKHHPKPKPSESAAEESPDPPIEPSEQVIDLNSEPADSPSSEPTPSMETEEEWLEFTWEREPSTETLPPVLKMIKKQSEKPKNKRLTKAEQKVQADTNLAILKMGLTGVDHVLERYGKAVTLDESYTVQHTDADKTIVAKAQWEYMKEKGLDVGHYISTGGVALALSGWYVGVPLYKIQQKKKKSLLGKGAGLGRTFLSKIPIIGKRFKKKEKFEMPPPIDEEEF